MPARLMAFKKIKGIFSCCTSEHPSKIPVPAVVLLRRRYVKSTSLGRKFMYGYRSYATNARASDLIAERRH
eukprot:scaffold451135_cov47-Attheya_sp.AAC.1